MFVQVKDKLTFETCADMLQEPVEHLVARKYIHRGRERSVVVELAVQVNLGTDEKKWIVKTGLYALDDMIDYEDSRECGTLPYAILTFNAFVEKIQDKI